MVPLKLLKMPVPDDFFNPPPLAADKIQELRAVGYRAQRDLLEYTKLTGGPVEWTLHTNEAREGNLPLFLGTTEVESTLDEVRAIFTAPTTSDVRRVNAAYFPDVLDEVRLYTLSTPTEDDRIIFPPSVGQFLDHRSKDASCGTATFATLSISRTSKCAVCLKKFGTFTRKTNCRRCGEVVCSKVCSTKWKLIMANLRVQLRVCIRCIPGPNEVEQEMMPLSTPMMKMALRDDLPADSESSNSSYTKASKQPQSYSSAWTYPTSTLSGGDGFAFSGMDCSKIFVDLKECNGPIERDDDTIRSVRHL
ncbi:hypothetical protein LEN26_016017 [Aphanomyces euteiches]|nr:hypothetical protein LEN26_016017 [Aphanomyces euteiches]